MKKEVMNFKESNKEYMADLERGQGWGTCNYIIILKIVLYIYFSCILLSYINIKTRVSPPSTILEPLPLYLFPRSNPPLFPLIKVQASQIDQPNIQINDNKTRHKPSY